MTPHWRTFGRLRFVESDERYSIYYDQDDNEVYLAHGTATVLTDLDSLNLFGLWQQWKRDNPWGFSQADGFKARLVGMLIDEDEVDEIEFCRACGDPEREDDLHGTSDGDVCESCLNDYYSCGCCEERFTEVYPTLHDDGDESVCSSCLNSRYYHCDSCDGYYHVDCYDEHQHQNEHWRCCESPQMNFSVPNAGERLRNNEVATVTLPAGVIDDVGIGRIASFLRHHSYNIDDVQTARDWRALSYHLGDLGEKWQTKDGNYTKRLSRLAYKRFGLKITPNVMSMVGTIASNHSREVNVIIDVTRDLNQSAEEFFHEDSCWFSTHYHGRCALKTNGGYGLRAYYDAANGHRWINGRAWVMPMTFDPDSYRRFRPTFNTDADAYFVFNGYGELEDYAPARIVAHMAGMTYRKITLSMEPMYINGEEHGGGGTGNGYLVAPEEIAEPYTDGHIDVDLDQHSNLYYREAVNV